MILVLVVTSFAANVQAQEVTIPDPGLNAAIRETLGKPSVTITVQDMEALRELDASLSRRGGSGPIQSLQGLDAAKNPTSLNLEGDCFLRVECIPGIKLTDFAPLAGLTNLTSLNLGGNQLTGLTLPVGLTSLNSLYLGNNHLTNFAVLSGLTSLTTLDLDFNQLTSVTLPAGLTSLNFLNLAGNRLTDFPRGQSPDQLRLSERPDEFDHA